MRILGARIFSKFFGGKIKNFQKEYMKQESSIFFKKNWRMRTFGARIFSKSFGGKIKHGQTDVIKETTFTKKIDITLAWKNCSLTLENV